MAVIGIGFGESAIANADDGEGYEKKTTEEKSKVREIIPKTEIANFYKQGIQMEPIYLIN